MILATTITNKAEKATGYGWRYRLHGTALGVLGYCTASAVSEDEDGREWLEIVQHDVALPRLPEQFEGLRVAHISDLHLSRTVSHRYLKRCVDRINRLDADVIALTGDYITFDARGRNKSRVIELIRGLRARRGVYACLGNHDYGVTAPGMRVQMSSFRRLLAGLKRSGIRVLRNASTPLLSDRGDQRLWLVGLGDSWSRDMKPERAFYGVPDDQFRIVLAHNPESFWTFQRLGADLVLCGHTHGRSVRNHSFGSPITPIRKRRSYSGLFDAEGTPVYVNRGLGRLGWVRFKCPPEIAVFTLHRAKERLFSDSSEHS